MALKTRLLTAEEKKHFRETIMTFLWDKRNGGDVTESIADKYNITNRQVGAMMRPFVKRGDVRGYPKGVIVLNGLGTLVNSAPMTISNSFYEAQRQF